MKYFACLLAIVAIALPATAEVYSVSYGWEDNPDPAILGNYQPITATVVNDPVYEGDLSLQLVDGGEGTPQAYVAWIEGLNDGDTITAGFWVYDTTPGGSPSGRIWGHYNSENDINAYAGSAGGNDTYSGAEPWSYLEHTWTYDSGTDRTGFVLEARTYSSLGDTIWVDAMDISVETDTTEGFIMTPGGTFNIPEPASLLLLGLGALLRRR